MNTSKPNAKPKQTADQSFLMKLVERFKRLPQKRLLFVSIFLHVVFFSLLFINWQHQAPIKPLHIPQNITAHVVKADQVKVLQEKKQAEKLAEQKKLENERRKLAQKKKLLQQKALEKKKAKEVALKKAAEQKKKAKEKKLKLKKQKEEKDKLAKAKLEKEKAAQRKQAEEKKRQEAQREKEALEKKQLAEAQQKKIKEQENKLLEKLQNLQHKKMLADQLAAENLKKEQAFMEYELSEIERFTYLIRSKIENLWRKPPKSDGLKVLLRIKLLPNGELAAVTVSESSGSSVFDNSAVLAVRSVRRFPVPEDSKVFEPNFRQFSMSFSPETL